MPEFNVGELVMISDLVYDQPTDLEALVIDYRRTIDDVDGGKTYEYRLITEKLGVELSITERFLERA